MFSGIVEEATKLLKIEKEKDNVNLFVECSFINELKIDQSIAHNGVCLTVVEIFDNYYKVTAIKETLDKSNLNFLREGDLINIERSMLMNGRLDGHIVQGHVDQTAECISIKEENGSWFFTFIYNNEKANEGYTTVEKGSVCVNGTSLTVCNSKSNEFSVAIIPYTYEHTNFNRLKVSSIVNLEFDILGKYIAKLISFR